MCCVDWQLTVYTGRRRCVVYLPAYLSYRGHLPGPLAEPPPPPVNRTGCDQGRGVALHPWRSPSPPQASPSSLPNKSHLYVNPAVTVFRAPGALW